MKTMDELVSLIKNHHNIVFFGGAGVSTGSGIPDFRGKDGLYNRNLKYAGYSPEYMLSRDCLEDHTELFFSFLREYMDTAAFQPNRAHGALAELEKRGKLNAVITQNIDGLHQKAGSKTVIELHGNENRCQCDSCGKTFPDRTPFLTGEKVPYCPDCLKNGIHAPIRPEVVLYGEMLPEKAWSEAVRYIRNADLLIVGGTSGTVYPAAGLVEEYNGKNLVIINRDETAFENVYFRRNYNLLIIKDDICEVFRNLISML